MTQTTESPISELRSRLRGEVVGADDPTYDDARRVWNASIDRRPLLIARCADEVDVQTVVSFAAERRIALAVRAGAHSMSGACILDEGIVLDLGLMNQVSVDADARRVLVGGGALLGDLDAATQPFGLAVPAGLVSHTGVGGLTLGGGMGWLSRKYGLSIDQLVSARVVTSDGEARAVSADENADLFWAIRGGGGNFGAVTQFEFELHEAGPMVHFGLLFWGLDQGREALLSAREIIATLPDDVNVIVGGISAPPAPFVPEEHHHQPGYAMIVVGFGDATEHADVLDRARAAVPPIVDFATPMPYVELQKMLDEANAWGMHAYDKGCYVDELSDGVIDAVLEHFPRKKSPLSIALFYRLDGAYSRVPEDATAFSGGRSPRFGVFIIGGSPVPEMFSGEREWVRSMAAALRPFAAQDGSYVNGSAEFDQLDPVQAAYGAAKFARLVEIKAKYDPANMFHSAADIAPVG
jgi:FAD binding domain-containing protein/berberine-like enzyme